MQDIAYTAVILKEPVEGKHFSLGLAERNVAGYTPIKHTGDPADPFYVAKGPTLFDIYEAAQDEAARRNEAELNLDRVEALTIVLSSMRG